MTSLTIIFVAIGLFLALALGVAVSLLLYALILNNIRKLFNIDVKEFYYGDDT